MTAAKSFDLSDLEAMTALIDAVFSEMNMGLVVYQLEDPAVTTSLRLVYANKQAAQYVGIDFQPLLGKYVLEAFPLLAHTGVPEQYAEVVRTKRSCNLGAFEYGSTSAGKHFYALKAFPMPNECVGVLFENITVRKHLEDMLKHAQQQLREKKNA